MLPEADDYAVLHHRSYKMSQDRFRKRVDWKKLKKKCNKSRSKQKKLELLFENDIQGAPEIELPPNASAFAVFASVRLAVLDRWMKNAAQEHLQSSCGMTMVDQSELESDTEDNSQSSTYVPVKVSKVVGLGLRSVFELIKESRTSHPALCTKALLALLDVLQGQSPEGLKSEPSSIIDSLFDLLLDLATLHGPESSVQNDGTHLTAVACACLLSLVVVRGDTGKYLSAAAALLMCPRALSVQNIQMPAVLSSLQRSIHGVLLGKLVRPDWLTHGVPQSSKIDSFQVKMPTDLLNAPLITKSLAFDGQYLYLFCSRGLLKIGSGYGGTVKGFISMWKHDFYPNEHGTLVFCAGKLYLKLLGRRGSEFLLVDKNNLLISGSVPLHSRDVAANVIFSDGEYLGTISAAKDDGFVVRLLNQNTSPASLISELPLKLARKCVDALGHAPYEEEQSSYTISITTEEEVASVCAGKDFGLLKTVTGKVLFTGKSSSLGIKQGALRPGKWSELVLTKSPKISHIAMGHDGLHAIMVAEDGAVFFTGTARRGEDGDQSKVRRQPKPVKPKKMIKVDGLHIVGGACNNGTTALVTRDGELLMFGKDTAHADPSTGLVSGLKGEFVTQVALGKAHAIALTSKGQVYTFGINNKFQCGRDFMKQTGKDGQNSYIVAMDTCPLQDEQEYFEDLEANQKETDNMAGCSEGNLGEGGQQNMCPPGAHAWHEDLCMVCTICRECTGYSISCLSSMSSERNPGQECGCGEGDSGCAICGCCRICAREVVDNSELADLAGMIRENSTKILPSKQRSKLQEQIQSRLDDRKNKSKKSIAGPSKQTAKVKSIRSSVLATPTHKANSTRQNNLLGTVKEQTGSDVERDAARIACLPPAKLALPFDSPVVQIACGLHHSVLLLQNGQVLTFGSNLYGQLGCGDILAKSTIQHVSLPTSAVHVAAGSNHTVVLTSKGEIYTFGNSEKGQLGRLPTVTNQDNNQHGQGSSSSRYNNPRTPWYSIPAAIPNVGPRHGRRATWVGASGDQTFLKLDESLINSVSIAKSTVSANKHSIILFPNHDASSRNFKLLVINKKDGNCNSFKGPEQVDFSSKMVCMDPIYNILWSYKVEAHEVSCYNIIASELQNVTSNECTQLQKVEHRVLSDIKVIEDKSLTDKQQSLNMILSPELALPVSTNCQVTRFQAALNLICCLDTLTIAHDLQITAVKEEVDERQMVTGKQYSKEDFQAVNRFESHGGGWGYSGHSIEAIRFMADTDILLGGFGLFGGRGEYTAKLKLLDIGPNGGEQEVDGELLAETEEVPYECGPRQKYAMLFDEPVQLQAHRWYVAWCRISGPSSDCGSSGQTMVTTEDQVLFYFKSSKKSNNGTDVNAGQIPQLLYKIVSPENQSPPRQVDVVEPMHILSKEFSRTVTKECFQSLLSLLQWSWNTFKWGIMEGQSIKNMYTNMELERLVYISTSSLRLICTYTNEIYPRQINRKSPLENVHLAECIGDVRTLLKQILSDNISLLMQNKKSSKTRAYSVTLMNSILQECHNTFVSCFHAFYPTAYLKWTCLCDLLAETSEVYNPHSASNTQMLLSAVLCALCAPSVRLRSTFPLLGANQSSENSLSRGLSPSDNTGHPMMSVSDSHSYPILVEQMSYKSQMESNYTGLTWTWTDVLERLINLVSDPIVRILQKQTTVTHSELSKYCCHLLSRVLAELVHQCSSVDDDLQNTCGRILHMTPSRFTRTNQSRTWNTGNGSPDAICFQVDRAGISIVGVGIYGGIGHYEYELELLEDTSLSTCLENHAADRWNSLEVIRGSFGPEDFAPDIVEIKFDRAVPIKENVKYAIRLRNHGGRTNNGDGGLNSVKGSDNTTFTFSTCSISFNGTTLTRGQIPVLLYYSNPIECNKTSTSKLEHQARKTALTMTSSIVQNSAKLMMLAREKVEELPSANILSDSCIVKTLLPLVLAHVSPLASSDPKSAVQVLNLIHELLPHVSALNLLNSNTPNIVTASRQVSGGSNDVGENKLVTTSNHCTWVESDHPYKPSTVTNYRVLFPDCVKWISLEFDPLCATAQPEDSLQLYIPAIEFASNLRKNSPVGLLLDDLDSPPLPYWPVLHKFSGSLQWPTNAVILPGNEVVFSLETASDYLKDDRVSAYGFKCLVIGYEWPPDASAYTGLKHLEAELAFLGGMCAAALMKKDLMLPVIGDEGDIDMEAAESAATQIFSEHSSLLSKGLALSSPPTVTQALDGMLPYSAHSNERLFLRDLVNCTAGSSGGRLAQWLQPGSRAEPSQCKVICAREELRQGWPAIVTVLTRDQYGEAVYVPNMKVEVKALPIDKKELGECDAGRKIRRVSQPDPLIFGGVAPPPLHHGYEPTIRDKMRFHSITVMKPFQNYSFEELRFTSPPVKRSSETMLVRPNLDGTYSATWTPASVGCYSIVVNIDGYEMEETFKVEVKDPPQGVIPPNQNPSKKSIIQPSKVRKFVAKNSAGLRIRAHPSLQSEQIGVVHVNGTIVFIDEIHNDDGVWLRLSADTIRQYCNPHVIEAWCLQYNQHLGKTLLLPVEEPKTILDQVITDTILRKLPDIQDKTKGSQISYKVIKCGASGHNVRSRPSLRAPPVGMLVLGNRIGVSEYVVNSEGCWVLLDKPTREKYCFNVDEDAWSLAIGTNNVLYLDNVTETDNSKVSSDSQKRGFTFTYPKSGTEFTFSGQSSSSTMKGKSDELSSSNPFIFGEPLDPSEPPKVPKRERKDNNKPKFRPKVAREGQANEGFSESVPRSLTELGSNGNGVTPPDTPKRSQSPRPGNFSPKPMSRSSSPIALPSRALPPESGSGSPPMYGSSRSIGLSPLVSGTPNAPDLPRRGSNQSDTSALVSSLTKDLSQSASQSTQPKEMTPSPSGSSLHTSPPQTPNSFKDVDQSSKKLTQTGTQTSPDNAVTPHVKGHFSIGSINKEEKLSPKLMRKERATTKVRPKRAISPANLHQLPSASKGTYQSTEPVKQAMSPSVAEALRAVFAAFLWHEGIVHDAMACASFLKFHPTLPKQGAQVVTRHADTPLDKRRRELTKEERARQRHSVEVSNAGNYLHIQPSTLESLTRSAANASANRNRPRKMTDGATICEESTDSPNYTYQTISVLPPALKSLVYLWEELTATCLLNMSEQEGSPSKDKAKRVEKIDPKEKNNCIEKESKKSKKKKVPPRNYLDIGLTSYVNSGTGETLCELCGNNYPHPVTYHMHEEHPGCARHAGGKGYNSGGNYCLGWAGNCGDGGVPGSSWYLLCDQCREKYMKTNKSCSKTFSKSKTINAKKTSLRQVTQGGTDLHLVMKNNAMFLLDLASCADNGMAPQRRSSTIMPSLSENITPPDTSGPFGPLPPFQCLQTLGDTNFFDESAFYNEVLNHQNFHSTFGNVPTSSQRPLSEVSFSETEIDPIKGSRFHRSVSMGTNGLPWAKAGYDGRIIMMRKRNNSSSELAGEGGSSLLCNPSAALQKLLPDEDVSSIVRNDVLNEHRENLNLMQRPVLQFVVQQHDLDSLKISMNQALRKAMCRVYAMQALNWLLRSVTQPICLHDLLWWFVTSLTPIEVEIESEEDNRPPKKSDEDLNICEHPLSDITIAGEAVHPLPSTFHSLLQTIAHIMILLPMGSPLQQISVRCWGLRFAPADHSFLHRSQVFNNISKILSRSEEMEDYTMSMHESAFNQPTAIVECLKDLTQSVEIRASSRQAMIASLTDGSTETFWESGDEDRNKTKSITIICAHGHHPVLVCVHVDNCRDLVNKISTITFYSGQNTDELSKLRTVEVETRLLGGWVNCPITEPSDNVVRLELKGPDNSVRLRQIRILGHVEGEHLKIGKLYSASTIQQRSCEAETLRVFRLITAQVFGKLIKGEETHNSLNNENTLSPCESMEPLEESNDLREHMVGILFSRSKLTHLQKQVIVHIVQAIRKETERVKEEWESNLYISSTISSNSSSDIAKSSDTYCFEMLSMVLALSGSSVGRAYLSHQGGLLGDLLTLLHTGSARVQRQVTSLLRRMLPEITPEFFAKVVGVSTLPPRDFNIVTVANKDSSSFKFDVNKPGILDIFLSVIAKSLILQVKLRSKSGNSGATAKEISTVSLATSVLPTDDVGPRWWLRGSANRKLAEVIVQLIADMSSGKMSEAWTNITKGAIAENILNLTYLSEDQRLPNVCLKTPTLWLALASLCVLDKDHVERLSSGQWSKAEGHPVPPRPMCSNHDDGETTAVIQCNHCGNLCADCDRFLHLHRKTRAHLRQVCKEEEEAIKVELHEGCGRTKLFWLLALADSRTLKALVEYREGGARTRAAGITGICRFCGTTGNSGLLAIGNVCADTECQEYGKTACTKLLNCGHMCGGVLGETRCLPCLHGCSNDSTLRQDSDDMCMVCFTEALSCAPAIQLQCGHVFHLHCCKAVLMKRWAGPRITFSFSLCPICKVEIKHPTLEELIQPIQELFKDVRRKALMRLEYEGLHTVEAVVAPGGRFHNDPASYAMDRYAYYVCYKCNKAYYGGEARCDAEAGDGYDPAELVCGACSDVARAQMCPKHGADFLEYKCRYCCSVAVFFCFGTTHFCNPCHDDFQRVTNLSKHELPVCPAGPRATQLEGDECPLHVKHPPTGEEFALGCGVCRNAHTF
ncbi:E3 ubiquitin-protein ligase MYCBP2 isoform X2 [Anthonomus grandis grandis]|uniref:E3 ubiquitin-protein ligase MYCBP2 isoform X2 n=1 Tax=Anthonomus grandis grandis TaxID=2921223 RepID=UPI0021660293|nr:E3 ubiquitin-protein ligase MYCBP2 isoform X2 [Anthonomus grandis grandis]